MMLRWFLVTTALLLILGVWIAASPPFALLGQFFSCWADRCHEPSGD